jgi:hypothetical protein
MIANSSVCGLKSVGFRFLVRRMRGSIDFRFTPHISCLPCIEYLLRCMGTVYLCAAVSNMLMEMRKICNHPYLVDGCEVCALFYTVFYLFLSARH